MAEEGVVTVTVGASALTQFQLVKTPAAVVQSAAVTDDCCGIVLVGAAANETNVPLRYKGKTRAIAASGNITFLAPLSAAANGRVELHDGTTANPIIGIALQASTQAGDEIEIDLGGHALRAGFAQ